MRLALVVGFVGSSIAAVTALAMLALVLWQSTRARENQLAAAFMAAIATWGSAGFAVRTLAVLHEPLAGRLVHAIATSIGLASIAAHALVAHVLGVSRRWWSRLLIGFGMVITTVNATSIGWSVLHDVHVDDDGRLRFALTAPGVALWCVAAGAAMINLALTLRRPAAAWLRPGLTLFALGVVVAALPAGQVGLPVTCAAATCVLFARAILRQRLFSPLATANRELEVAQHRLAALIRDTRDALWSVDRELRLTAYNPAFVAQFAAWHGVALEPGRPLGAQVPAAALARWRPLYERAFAGARVEAEEELEGPAGPVTLALELNPITDDAGGVVGCAVVAHDVTEQRRVARLKDDFLATVSHELRTPLTSILGAVKLVRGGVAGPVSPAVGELLATTDRNAERLLVLVNDLLDLQKLEAGALPIARRAVARGPFLVQVLETHRAYADRYQVTLALADEGGADLDTDPDRATQVLANLISNAVKFSPPGEVVEVGARDHGARVRVWVRDRGPGIPAAFQPHLYAKFAQARPGGSAQGGSGLGLAISKALVDQLDGALWFETAAGQGTTLFVELPGYSAAS